MDFIGHFIDNFTNEQSQYLSKTSIIFTFIT